MHFKTLERSVYEEDAQMFFPHITNRWASFDIDSTNALNELRKIKAMKQVLLSTVPLGKLPSEWNEYLLQAK
jgi:hypothetical protein